MTLLRITTVCAALVLGLGYSALRADDKPDSQKPEVVQPVNKELDKHLDLMWKHITDTYAGELPADWAAFPARFNGTMTTPGYLRAVTALGATSAGDRRLRVMSPAQTDQYKCRHGGGYIGIGVDVKCVLGTNGLSLDAVRDGGLAQKAGLQTKDQIKAINETSIVGLSQAEAMKLLSQSPNSMTSLLIVREGKEHVFGITRGADEKLGVIVGPAAGSKLLVDKVYPGSPAELAGVANGDILTHVNGNDTERGDLSWINNQLGCSQLGHERAMTVRRGEKVLTFELKGAVVTVPAKAAQAEIVGIDGQTFWQIRIQNLDWVELPKWLDALKIAAGDNVLLDLRDCSGDNPEVMARVALRFLERGHVLKYSQRQGSAAEVVTYAVEDVDGSAALIVARGGKNNTVETVVNRRLTGKLLVLVDDATSGTAEVLASTLKANRGATLIGRPTSGRNKLVVTTTFEVEKEVLFVQVPALTVLAGDGSPAQSVRPDTVASPETMLKSAEARMLGKTEVPASAYAWVLLLLVFAVSLACSLKPRTLTPEPAGQSGSKWKRVIARAVAVSCIVLAAVWAVRSTQSQKPVSEKEQALARVVHVLRTDENARQDVLGGMHIERGPNDVKFDWSKTKEENNRIQDAEIEAACQLATALADGNLEALRAIVTSYRGKPYARAQVTAALNHAVYLCGSSVDVMALHKWVRVESTDLVDGQFSLSISAAQEDEVSAQFMLRDFEHPRQFQTSPTKIVSPDEVMRQLQHDFLNSLLSKHPRMEECTN